MTTPRSNSLFSRIGAAEPAPPWGLETVALTLVVSFLALIVGTFAAVALVTEADFAPLLGWIIGAAFIILFIVQSRRRDGEALRLNPSATPYPFILFIGVGFAIAFDILALGVSGAFLPMPELLGLNLADVGVVDWVLAFAFMVIAQPVAEELVFRGVAFPALRATFGAWAGLIVTALLYAAFHLLAYGAPAGEARATLMYGLIVPFLAGLVIGAVRAYTGSTRAAMVAHAAFGLFAVIKLIMLVG